MKTILNEKLIEEMCGYLKEGVPILTTCQAVGISESTYYDWFKRGEGTHQERSQEKIYVEFVQEVRRAIAESEVNLLRDIIKDKSWHAKAWVLSRRFPERWSKKSALENEQKIMPPHEIINNILEQFSSIPEERLKEIASRKTRKHDID